MRDDYKAWLASEGYAENTQAAQLHRLKQVEAAYGAIDDLVNAGTLDDLMVELTYSAADERAQRPNPSRLSFTGNTRNRLASHRDAVRRYLRFLAEATDVPEGDVSVLAPQAEPAGQKLALERDMQIALRREITALEPGMRIVDDGMEVSVDSGFIDILCEDPDGTFVVVELKAGKSDSRVVAQTLGYMGDLMEEDEMRSVRGIIVAHDFDRRTIAAARAVPALKLCRYQIAFSFSNV